MKYDKAYKTFSRFLRHVFRLKITGIENLPESGCQILCSNHIGNLDPLIISCAFPRQVCYMAKKELFSIPILSNFLLSLGTFPVDRGANDVGAIKKTVKLLSEGHLVGIFPQGTRYRHVDPRTTEVRGGVGMIAHRAHADIIPVYIKTKNNRSLFFRKTELIIGRVITYDELGFTGGGHDEYMRASKMIFDKICQLS